MCVCVHARAAHTHVHTHACHTLLWRSENSVQVLLLFYPVSPEDQIQFRPGSRCLVPLISHWPNKNF